MCIKVKKINKKFVLEEDHEDAPNLLQDLKLLLNILKTLGVFPIFSQISQNEIEPPSKQNKLYSIFIRAIIHFLTIFNLYSMFHQSSVNDFNTARDTDNINQYIEIIITITTYTGTIILCAKHSKDFFRIIKEILKLDCDIKLRYKASVRNNCKFSHKAIIGIVACQLFIISMKFIGGLDSLIQYLIILFYGLQNCICSMFIVLLSSLLRVLSMRFEFVNMILDNYTYNVIGKKVLGPNNAPFEEEVSFAFRLHNKLLKIYKLLNESCSLVVAFFMGYAFYTITTNTYNIFVEFTTNMILSWNFLLDCFVWLILNSVLLAILAQSCGQTTKKANTTSQILARVYKKNKDYQNIIDKFLTKSIRQEIQFTAYGFFVVDNSTLFKIFSAVTTYLVILIQFKQLEDTKMDEDDADTQ